MKCDDNDLPIKSICSPNEEISGNVTLCGNPQPTVSWMVGDKAFNGSVDDTNASQHQYTYSFKRKIYSEMCGEIIYYRSTELVKGLTHILFGSCELFLYVTVPHR